MLVLCTCLVNRYPLVLEPRFSASRLLSVAAHSGATALLYVGDLGRLLLATPESPADRSHALRVAVGNGMAPEIWQKFQARFGIDSVREFYAATESPVGIFNLSGRVGSVGNLPYAWMFGRSSCSRRRRQLRATPRAPCEARREPESCWCAPRTGLGVYHARRPPRDRSARRADAFTPRALVSHLRLLKATAAASTYFVERWGDGFRFRVNVSVSPVSAADC